MVAVFLVPCGGDVRVHLQDLPSFALRKAGDPFAIVRSGLLPAALLKDICRIGVVFRPGLLFR